MTPDQRQAALRLAEAMQAGADDPMWAHHAEITKSTLNYAAALLRDLAAEPVQEPVQPYINCWAVRDVYFDADGNPAMHQDPPQRQPLTDEQITAAVMRASDELLDHIYEYGTTAEGVQHRIRVLARAIERAHGITGEKR
jgi:hypothetical protein